MKTETCSTHSARPAFVACVAFLLQAGLASAQRTEPAQELLNEAQRPTAEVGGGGSDTLPPRVDRISPAPSKWIVSNLGLERVRIGFDEPVTIPAGAVAVQTATGGTIKGFTSTYDDINRLLTVEFPASLRNDRVVVVLDYTITDLAGNELDGEIASPATAALPSGDGTRGGQAVFQFNVLQGDANTDGTVDNADANLVLSSIGMCLGAPGFIASADLNGDGCINALDVATYSLNEGASLPSASPQPSLASVTTDSAVGPAGTVPSIDVRFSGPVAAGLFSRRSLHVVDETGQLLVPSTASLSPDGLSASFDFNPALQQCIEYKARVSNGLSDGQARFLLTPSSPVTLGVVPANPVLDPYVSITSSATVQLTGTALADSTVEVSTPLGLLQTMVPGGVFAIQVPLETNTVNQVFLRTISSCNGEISAPTCAEIAHDSSPPELFLDGPADGLQATASQIDVFGRIGDQLTGSSGLSVTVNGAAAQVDFGIGTNGTFFFPALALALGDNVVDVIASDTLGNSVTESISVSRLAPPVDEIRLAAVSGNGQAAQVLQPLAQPVVVLATETDGVTPLVNKLVTFKVSGSDGRLAATGGQFCTNVGPMMLQCFTDGSGQASALWTLGSESGSGNNRVDVSAMSASDFVRFCASANGNSASQINASAGNNQRGEVGNPAIEPLRVWVNDSRNGVASVGVTFTVTQGGGTVNGMSEVTVTTEPTGHASVDFEYGLQPGVNTIEASLSKAQIGPVAFVLVGLEREESTPTSFATQVVDNAGQPIEGATCTIIASDGSNETTFSDERGVCQFDELALSGPVQLGVLGQTATAVNGVAIPPGSFPSLSFHPIIVPNTRNSLGMPVRLPPLNPANVQVYSRTEDVELTIGGLEGLKMTVTAGSMYVGGALAPTGTTIALNTVHVDDIPMSMPDGAAPSFAWTLQPSGAVFDPPVKVEYPNSRGLPPGAVAYVLSFDHDTMSFEIVSSARVSDDGSMVVSDPGDGIRTAGWGGFCPPYPGVGTVQGAGTVGEVQEPDASDGVEEKATSGNAPAAPVDCLTGGAAGSTPSMVSSSSNTESDPVYYFSGEFYEEIVDLRIRGRGQDFRWTRKYASKRGVDSAQGNSWDFGYNVFIEPQDDDILLCDGATRRDVYRAQNDGTWCKAGFFRDLSYDADNSVYRMAFANKGEWVFGDFNGSPSAGRLKEIIDRNGNKLSFAYDGLGRLAAITDTLVRDINIGYVSINVSGQPRDFINTVTDFTGRQVQYEYYQDGDADGSAGDLKSVRSPIVTGTPTGNDFPQGKTTTYTYTTGFADEALNHDLLTVTDAKGQTYLVNTYAHTIAPSDTRFATDPGSVYYDRLVRQVWGDPGDVIDFDYVPVSPTAENNQAVMRSIINDRVGNVREYFYDARNQGVIERKFTGRANPDQPTTATLNRPTGKLRADDPTFFETRHFWNNESLLLKTVHQNGNITANFYEIDLNSDTQQRGRANLRWRFRFPGSHVPAGDQTMVAEEFKYDTGFASGCCGFNFVTEHTDGRGNTTFNNYDDNGNRIQTQERISSIVHDYEYNVFGQLEAHDWPDNGSSHRQRDEYTYYDSGPQTGYMSEELVDAGPANLSLTTAYEYDTVGNIVRVTDPRGHDMQYVVNELDQVVREISREVTDGNGLRYQTDTHYDANNNVARVDIQNIDETGTQKANAHLTTVYEYEILNYPVRVCAEVGNYSGALPGTSVLPVCTGLPASDFLTTEYAYDANRNQTLTRYGEAVEGRQPDNVVQTLYDERDLVFQVIRAPGAAVQSTTQLDYDGNRNIALTRSGLECESSGLCDVYLTSNVYDSYDRVVESTDPMGNVTAYRYDANGNIGGDQTGGTTNPFGIRVMGEPVDVIGGAGNIRLSETTFVYDALDRPTRTEVSFFDDQQNDLLGGQQLGNVITDIEYTDRSQIRRTVDDNLHEKLFSYDTANRLDTTTDALANEVVYAYDANNNVITATENEKSTIDGSVETFTTTNTHDNLDRLATTTDNLGNTDVSATGNTQTFGYDSRNNRTVLVDALSNETRYIYDGINRLIQTVRDLNGNGASAIDKADIVTAQEWDDTSRLIAQIDDAGNATRYAHDPLNRQFATRMADGTVHVVGSGRLTWLNGATSPDTSGGFVFGHDVHDNAITNKDANGSVVQAQYDLLNRVTGRTITPGPGVSVATTSETYSYDGLSRLVLAEDNDSRVTRTYDSMSNILTETQFVGTPFANGRTVTDSYDGVGNKLTCNYPGSTGDGSQGRTINTAYDELNRKKTIADAASGLIATYDYVGPARVARRDYGNGTRTEYTYDGITGTPNAANDFGVKRIVRTKHSVVSGGAIIDERTYNWDRMFNKTQRKDVRAAGPQLIHDYEYDPAYRMIQSVKTPMAGTPEKIDYTLDGVGNRNQVQGGTDSGTFTLDATLPEPADLQLNQYTTTPFDERAYDKNGDLVQLDQPGGTPDIATIGYDYRNQMVEYVDLDLGQRHTYRYDTLGRRIEKAVNVDAASETTRYYYDRWQACDEQDASGETQATYVSGPYLDEVLTMRRSGTDHYYHTDDLYNIMAITDVTGAVAERYEYGDFGVTILFDSQEVELPTSPIANPFSSMGRRLDSETSWYYCRTRYYDPAAGRFTSPDTLGTWGDPGSLGNTFAFVANNPWTNLDPFGTIHAGQETFFHNFSAEEIKTAQVGVRSFLDQEVCDYLSPNDKTELANQIVKKMEPFEAYNLKSALEALNAQNANYQKVENARKNIDEIKKNIEGRLRDQAKFNKSLEGLLNRFEKAKKGAKDPTNNEVKDCQSQ